MAGAELETAIGLVRSALPGPILPRDAEALRLLTEAVPNLPEEVRRLYEQVGGMVPSTPFYLMPPKEVQRVVEQFREYSDLCDDSYEATIARCGDGRRFLLLFDDWASNYFGLHLGAPYLRRGLVLHHEEPITDPKFQSLASTLVTMVNHHANPDALDCIDAPTDYPVIDARWATDQDRQLSVQLLAKHQERPDSRTKAAFGAMQLSHPDDMDLFVPFLDSPDPWIAERMCRLVGLRRYESAIPRMVDAAAERGHNRVSATIVALQDWPSDAANAGLLSL